MTGIDVAKKISNSSWIVFVTAFDDYAVEAFENEAIDYLLKPVTTERLKKTVNRIHRRLKSKSDNKINYEQLQKYWLISPDVIRQKRCNGSGPKPAKKFM